MSYCLALMLLLAAAAAAEEPLKYGIQRGMDRVYIKRPLPEAQKPPPEKGGQPHKHPKQFDNGKNHGCVPDRALVEACIVTHQKDTREAFQCYGRSVRDQAPRPDPCFSDAVTGLADKCYERHEFEAGTAFECLFEKLGLPKEEVGEEEEEEGKKERY